MSACSQSFYQQASTGNCMFPVTSQEVENQRQKMMLRQDILPEMPISRDRRIDLTSVMRMDLAPSNKCLSSRFDSVAEAEHTVIGNLNQGESLSIPLMASVALGSRAKLSTLPTRRSELSESDLAELKNVRLLTEMLMLAELTNGIRNSDYQVASRFCNSNRAVRERLVASYLSGKLVKSDGDMQSQRWTRLNYCAIKTGNLPELRARICDADFKDNRQKNIFRNAMYVSAEYVTGMAIIFSIVAAVATFPHWKNLRSNAQVLNTPNQLGSF